MCLFYSFIQDFFIMKLLSAKYCARHWIGSKLYSLFLNPNLLLLLFSLLANGIICPFISFNNLLSNYSMLSLLTGREDEIVSKMGPCLEGIYILMEEIDSKQAIMFKCLKWNSESDDGFFSLLYALHSIFSATPHRASHDVNLLGTSCIPRGPCVLSRTALLQLLSSSLLIPPAGLLTSLPNSPSIFKQAKFSFWEFFLFPYPRQNTNSSWPSLMWFRHIYLAAFSSFFPFLFAPVFLSTAGLFVQSRHYMLSFLPLHLCSSLLVHFVLFRAV